MNIGVIGGSKCSPRVYKQAFQLGEKIASKKWILICGGGSGVMEAACRGAKAGGGTTVGILPSSDTSTANAYLDITIPTGFGYARNILVVRASEVIVAFSGAYGTLSELSFALNEGKPVFGLDTWPIKGVRKVRTPAECIQKIISRKRR